jgi:hypothetical protein
MTGGPFSFCASAGIGATANAMAVVSAVNFDVFLRNAMRNDMAVFK